MEHIKAPLVDVPVSLSLTDLATLADVGEAVAVLEAAGFDSAYFDRCTVPQIIADLRSMLDIAEGSRARGEWEDFQARLVKLAALSIQAVGSVERRTHRTRAEAL